MRIWYILLSLFSYCKSQAFTLNTLWGFCKIYAKSTFFVLARGGGVNFNISSSLYFHFVIKFRLLLSICGLHVWCPPQSENASYAPAKYWVSISYGLKVMTKVRVFFATEWHTDRQTWQKLHAPEFHQAASFSGLFLVRRWDPHAHHFKNLPAHELRGLFKVDARGKRSITVCM